MDIKAIPNGAHVLVDANIFIYYLGGLSTECYGFLQRVTRGEVQAHLTTTIVAEVLHRRMVAEALAKGLVSPSKILQKLKAHPEVIKQLTDYNSEVERLLQLPIEVHEIISSDLSASQALRTTYGLFVNDSINLACALRLGVNQVVSHDGDFNRVNGITVWEPEDV